MFLFLQHEIIERPLVIPNVVGVIIFKLASDKLYQYNRVNLLLINLIDFIPEINHRDLESSSY